MEPIQVTITDDQLRQLAAGDLVTIVPAKAAHQVEVSQLGGALVAKYVPTRTRDHCTAEERAVIEAAAKRRKVFLKYGEAYHEYDTDLNNACDALLAARKEQ